MRDSIDDLPEELDVAPPKQVVILSLLDGKTVHTFCPHGTTLEQAMAVYLPEGAEVPRVMTEQEVAAAFPGEG